MYVFFLIVAFLPSFQTSISRPPCLFKATINCYSFLCRRPQVNMDDTVNICFKKKKVWEVSDVYSCLYAQRSKKIFLLKFRPSFFSSLGCTFICTEPPHRAEPPLSRPHWERRLWMQPFLSENLLHNALQCDGCVPVSKQRPTVFHRRLFPCSRCVACVHVCKCVEAPLFVEVSVPQPYA